MYRDKYYGEFIQAIKEKLPERGKLTSELVSILAIEKEALYRRMRGDVAFSFSEIFTIAKALDISLDSIISSCPKNRPLRLKMVDYLNFEEDDYSMLNEFLNALKTVANDPESEVGGALNIPPPSLTLGYKYLYRFYLFKWYYQYGGYDLIKPYSEIQAADKLVAINEEIKRYSRMAGHTYLIWDQNVFLNLVNDIKYFASINLITKEEIAILKEDILEYVSNMEAIASSGKAKNGNRINFYVSSVTFETSYSYVESKNIRLTMIKSFTLNDATTRDEYIFERMKRWMQSLKRTSTLISESGEMQRIRFFNKQYEIINSL